MTTPTAQSLRAWIWYTAMSCSALVSYVCCYNAETMTGTEPLLDPVGGVRKYVINPGMYWKGGGHMITYGSGDLLRADTEALVQHRQRVLG